jgi:TatD DNase family protein
LRQILRRQRDHDGQNASGQAWGTAAESAYEDRAGILHCFTGSVEDARELVDLGFYVSFAGNITYKKAENLREAACSIPLQRLLSETDCPYLAPVPHRGERNEPALVRDVTRSLAGLHGSPEGQMGHQLVENFETLFELGD